MNTHLFCGIVRRSHQIWAVVLDQHARTILRCEYACHLPEDLEGVFTHLCQFAEIYGAQLHLAFCNPYGNGELFDPSDPDYKGILKVSEATLRGTDLPGNGFNGSDPYDDPKRVAVINSLSYAQQTEQASTFAPKPLTYRNSDCPF